MIFLDLIVPVVFFILGVIAIVKYFSFLINGKISSNWPATDGIIIDSRIENILNGEILDTVFLVKYSFCVDAKEYIGDKIFFKTQDFDNFNYKKKYFLGKKVKVFYNPKNPKEAVLEPGIKGGAHVMLIMGLILLTVSTLMFLLSIFPKYF